MAIVYRAVFAFALVASTQLAADDMPHNAFKFSSGATALQFGNPNHFSQVRLVHDTVMGGRSNGALHKITEPDGLRFSGHLSLANNGGFASVQFTLASTLPGIDYQRILLQLAADGRTYQLRLKTPFIPGGVAYVADFKSSIKSSTYTFEASDFRGQFRGRRVANLPTLKFADVTQVSIMLADKTSGPYAIELYSIDFSAIQSI